MTKADGNSAKLEMSIPSDSKGLKRDHIQCKQLDALHVLVGSGFTQSVSGKATQEPPNVWHEAVEHILTTFKPSCCYIQVVNTESVEKAASKLELSDGTAYHSFRNPQNNILSIIR